MSDRDPLRDLREYAAHLESSVHPGRARARADAALAGARPAGGHAMPRFSRAVAAASATMVFLAVFNVGLAAIADPAAPGDPLYGIDRAYEAVTEPLGLAGDTRLERLEEAEIVAERDDPSTAVTLLEEALDGVAGTGGLQPMLATISGDRSALQRRLPMLIALGRDIVIASEHPSAGGLEVAVAAMADVLVTSTTTTPGRPVEGSPSATAPGQDGENPSATAPGQDGENPSATAPGQDGDSPSATAPGQDGDSPSATAPGQDGDNPSATSPGQASTPPGQDDGRDPSATAPGQDDDPPAQEDNPSATAPGQDGDSPSATAPGQGDDNPGSAGGRGGSGRP